jgi:hypothetical protein
MNQTVTQTNTPEGLLALEILLSDQRVSTLEQLSSSLVSSGEQALQDLFEGRAFADPTPDISSKVNERVSQLDQTIIAARRHRLLLIKGAHDQRALQLLNEATRLRHESGRLRSAVTEVLAKLAGLEEVAYDPSILLCQRIGPWTFASGKSADECGPGEAYPDVNGTLGTRGAYAIPRHLALANEATRLEGEAQIELDYAVLMHGNEIFESLDELLGALAADHNRLWPTITSIREFVTATRETARKQLGNKADSRHTQIHLSWKSGTLDPEISHIALLRETAIHPTYGPDPTKISIMTEVEKEISVGNGGSGS